MALTLKTPGVYIEERNAFPNSVVGVETAVPAFIGYTEKSSFKGQSLMNKPVRIESFMEFELFYGGPTKTIYGVQEVTNPTDIPLNYDINIKNKAYSLEAEANTRFNLYDSLKFFYQNGGGSCFIVSVGTYGGGDVTPAFSKDPFAKGIDTLKKETEPTMLVIPDAVLLDADNCYSLQQDMLMHCGVEMNRIAILDIHDGDKGLDDPTFNPIDNFRNRVASNQFSYGAAYYPWLHTTIVQAPDISFQNLNEAGITMLQEFCNAHVEENLNEAQKTAIVPYINALSGTMTDAEVTLQAAVDTAQGALTTAEAGDDEAAITAAQTALDNAVQALNEEKERVAAILATPNAKANADAAVKAAEEALANADDDARAAAQTALDAATATQKIIEDYLEPSTINSVLNLAIPDYKLLMEAVLKKKNLLPPSAAMAGIYSLVDAQRGVWKAPANVAVNSVIGPSVLIDHKQQEDLNAPILGKSICAIRPFIGLGTMVWGGRTLDGNSLDWRYINVRRTMIMMEQSIKFAAKAYVFEPNVKNTWVTMESMISNFLTNLWKQGALAGAVPEDAFSVNVGLGTTMTATDILEGIMRIEVKVAVSRPAEFIVISFEQQMQKS